MHKDVHSNVSRLKTGFSEVKMLCRHSHLSLALQHKRILRCLARHRGLHISCAHQTPAPTVTVVGGGAAGLTAAFFAASEGAEVTIDRACTCAFVTSSSFLTRVGVNLAHVALVCQVTVLERTREVGKKILISGGARWYALPTALSWTFALAASLLHAPVIPMLAPWMQSLHSICP